MAVAGFEGVEAGGFADIAWGKIDAEPEAGDGEGVGEGEGGLE